MQKLLTLVIPTYNMQDYLKRCLDSLIVAPELMEQLEVLVINDGSKDNSSAIGHEYEAKCPSTFRVIDKENGNYGSCVNRGLKEAQGKYIKILDADDWFDTSEFSKYLSKLVSVDVDLVLSPYKIVNESGVVDGYGFENIPENQSMDFNSCLSEEMLYYTMHMVAYRTSMLRDFGYQQTEGISYTDNEWTHIPQYSVGQFVYFSNPIYQYFVGRDGQTMSDKALIRNVWNFEKICKSLLENMSRFKGKGLKVADESNLREIVHSASFVYRIVLIKMVPSEEDRNQLKEFDDYLKTHCTKAYDETAKLIVNKKLPFHFVRFWRNTGMVFPIGRLRSCFVKHVR